MTYTLTPGATGAAACTIVVHLPTVASIAGERVTVDVAEAAREVRVACVGLLPAGGLRIAVPCAAARVRARFAKKASLLTLEVQEGE